ncbi:MAG TPA: homoserine dehydrogenase [Candidatus Brocadiia bacterium]|nr:homoserine dehydrogenase [Candidatus Brocadiia bacterium]
MKQVQVGLIGMGTVGGGVARLLTDPKAAWRDRLGNCIKLKTVADLYIDSLPISTELPGDVCRTKDANEILRDPEISVVVELIGGIRPAMDFITTALESGKNVVTANKALLAAHGHEIFTTARNCDRCVAFEASVCGGIPIIAAIRDGLIANNFSSIYGIVNGTCNYILTQMTQQGAAYSEALAGAQAKGYAEADPTLDVEGHDSRHKLAVLARLAYGCDFDANAIYCEGITKVQAQDIAYAKKLGYVVKLLAIARSHDEAYELRVHPALLRESHPLASVNDSFNAVSCEGDAVGRTMFYGRGAGREPTASAVMADIADIALGRAQITFARLGQFAVDVPHETALPISEVRTRYYLRFSAVDKPGVLASVAGILGANDVSISSVIQPEVEEDAFVPLILMTHKAREGDVLTALNAINALDCIEGSKTSMLRVAAA